MSHCASENNSLENFAQGLTFKGKSHIIRATSKTDYSFLHGATLRRRPSFFIQKVFYHRDVISDDKTSAHWRTV